MQVCASGGWRNNPTEGSQGSSEQQPGFSSTEHQPTASRLQFDRISGIAGAKETERVQTEPSTHVNNKSKRKRIRRKENKGKEISLKLMANNTNSLATKLEALEHILCTEKPSILFLQKTKLRRPGRIKTPSSLQYTWYELHRTEHAKKGEQGGGLAIGV